MTIKLYVLLITLLVVVPIDQLSKAWVTRHIAEGSIAERIEVVEGFFYISHARNRGAAFGLLVDWPAEWRTLTFLLVAAIALVVIRSFFRTLAPGDRFNALALGLLAGGALGNLSDRLLRGEVVDFLHVRLWGEYSWPDFNIADACIVVGVTALILDLLASEGASRAEVHSDRDVDEGQP